MAAPCFFIFAVHNHQPIGNFDEVVDDACREAYAPFLEVLERHPRLRIAMHFSGCLLDVLVARHPGLLERLRALAEAGRIEVMTGGYYEPILAAIPPHDRLGQIRKMSETVERLFGQRPTGLWLAERVWEPRLPETLARAGVRWCAVDEALFRAAGAGEPGLFGYWTTEDQGCSVQVFPILEKLRYTIPFADPEKTFEYLREAARGAEGPLLAFVGDDGEKFGVWPGTHKLCYTNGWLERFFNQWEAALEEFPPLLPREALERFRPQGRIYLPAGSYPEMMAWALPAAAGRACEEAGRLIEEKGIGEAMRPFPRGGLWSNFLAKYPESDHIHKKMLLVSRRLEATLAADPQDPALISARDFLWRGQCNCAMWHGLFGGLYLVHLRHALQRSLNIANRLWGERTRGAAPWIEAEKLDYDADGAEERLIETDRWFLLCAPERGGALLDVTWKPRDLNLCDTLARREEAYHPQVGEAVVEAITDEEHDHAVKDPWGRLLAKQPGLARYLCYDTYRRLFAIDHLLPPETTLEQFRDRQARELGDFVDQPYQEQIALDERSISLTLQRTGTFLSAEGPQTVQMTKILTLAAGEDALTILWRIRNGSARPLGALWGMEFNINLLAGDAPDRYPFVEGREVSDRRLAGDEETEEVRVFGLVDEWMDLKVTFALSEPARLWRTGLETVSLSERGLEGNYQGTCLLPHWRLELEPGGQRDVRMTVACAPWREKMEAGL